MHERSADLNTRILPRGVKVHAYQDRSELMKLTTHALRENLGAGVAASRALKALGIAFFGHRGASASGHEPAGRARQKKFGSVGSAFAP